MISEAKAAELVISGITVALNMMNDEGASQVLIGTTLVEADQLGRVGHAIVRWSIAEGHASPMLLLLALGTDPPTASDYEAVTRLFSSHSDPTIANATCQLLTRVRFEVA